MTDDEVLGQLNAALAHDPDRDKNYYHRGLIYARRGQWSDAEADFAKAFSLWTDPEYLSQWREAARERQAMQSLEERMAPYAEIIRKIKDIGEDAEPIDESETVEAAEIIAAMALFEEYELLETLFEAKQFTPQMLNTTVRTQFAYWEPTPLYFITSKKPLAQMQDPCRMMRFLAALGADPNVPAGDGSTMLWNQCNSDNPLEIMEAFLEIGADPNQICTDSTYDWAPLAYCLLPLPVVNSDGEPVEDEWHPLSSLAKKKIKLLLEHKADPNLANPSIPDEPPLALAVRFKEYEIGELLLTYGAKFPEPPYEPPSRYEICP